MPEIEEPYEHITLGDNELPELAEAAKKVLEECTKAAQRMCHGNLERLRLVSDEILMKTIESMLRTQIDVHNDIVRKMASNC